MSGLLTSRLDRHDHPTIADEPQGPVVAGVIFVHGLLKKADLGGKTIHSNAVIDEMNLVSDQRHSVLATRALKGFRQGECRQFDEFRVDGRVWLDCMHVGESFLFHFHSVAPGKA